MDLFTSYWGKIYFSVYPVLLKNFKILLKLTSGSSESEGLIDISMPMSIPIKPLFFHAAGRTFLND